MCFQNLLYLKNDLIIWIVFCLADSDAVIFSWSTDPSLHLWILNANGSLQIYLLFSVVPDYTAKNDFSEQKATLKKFQDIARSYSI